MSVARRLAQRARLWVAGVVVELLFRAVAREQRIARGDHR